jgi:hypothetical protein
MANDTTHWRAKRISLVRHRCLTIGVIETLSGLRTKRARWDFAFLHKGITHWVSTTTIRAIRERNFLNRRLW